MPGTALLNGPRAPGPLGFCAVCAASAKHAAIAPDLNDIQLHERSGDGFRTWLLDVSPAAAVAWGVYPPLGAALPLCWTHLVGLDVRISGVLPASANSMPPHPGGAVDLSQRRRG